MKRNLSLFLIFCILSLMLSAVGVSAETYGDLTYSVSNGEITITDCSTSETTIEVPSTINGLPVTSIGYKAFEGCSSLTSVNIKSGVTNIGDMAFRGCSSLTSINIPSSVTSIHEWAFCGCNSLTSISIPSSVTSIGDSEFWGCRSLKDVYYQGSEEQWNNISIISGGNYWLTTATIHYNYSKPFDSVNSNNPEELANNTPRNIPNNINDGININYSGSGYAYFVLRRKDGTPYAKRSYEYIINGDESRVVLGQTDVNGLAGVYTKPLTVPGNKKTTQTVTVKFLNDDLLQNTFSFNVTLNPISFKETWTGSVTTGVSAGLKLGVGGSLAAANESLGAEAELASVGASGKNKKIISIENVYKDGSRDLRLSTAVDKSIAVNAKIGLIAGIGSAANLSLGSVSGDISTGYALGNGYYIKNYNANNPDHRQKIELFLLDTAMGLDGSNVVPRMLFDFWLERKGLKASNEENSKITLLCKAGASAPSVKLGSFSTEVVNGNADGLFEFKTNKNYENKTTTSTKTKVSAGYKLYNTSYKNTFGNSDMSISTKSAVNSSNLLNNSIEFSATKDSSGSLESISLKTAEDSKISAVLLNESSTEYFKNITYKGTNAQNIVSKNKFMQDIADGHFSFFGVKSAQGVVNDMATGQYQAEYTREKEKTEKYGQAFKLGVDGMISVDFGIEGLHKYSFTEQTGIIDNGYQYKKTHCYIDDKVETQGESLKKTINDIAVGMKSDISALVSSVKNKVNSGVEWGKAKISGISNSVAKIVGINSGSSKIRSYSILSVAGEGDTIKNASVATTIGEPYIIEFEDADGNKLTKIDDGCSLTIDFDEEDFAAANIPFTTDMMQNLKIYHWDEEKAVYVCMNGTVDVANHNVSIDSLKDMGQFILGIDNCPPAITNLSVSSNCSTPTISANIADMSGISTITLKLDGNTVSQSDWEKYYDAQTSTFTYTLPSPLADNSTHSIEIYATDTSGNSLEQPEKLNFTVDAKPPVITSFDVPELSTDTSPEISATVSDSNIANVVLIANYDGEDYSYPMNENNGKWTANITGMPKFANLKVSVKAFDSAGNQTESEKKNLIIAENSASDDIYLGILSYNENSADIIINNTASKTVNATLSVTGYDKNDNITENNNVSVSLNQGSILKNVKLNNNCFKIRAELIDSENEQICTGFTAYANKLSSIEHPEMPVVGELDDCYYSDNGITANIKLNKISQNCNAIIVIYDKSGKLITFKETPVSTEETSVSLKCNAKMNDSTDYYAKILFWDKTNNITPLGKPILINEINPKN